MKVVESDHNAIISKFKIPWKSSSVNQKIEIFNLKNRECQIRFKNETSSDVNNKELSSIFDEHGDINVQTKKFIKMIEKLIHKCFKKIRVKERKDEEKDNLFRKWRNMKNKYDENSQKELKDIEKVIADKYAEEYFQKIKERAGDIDSMDGGMKSESFWNLKKELFPQSRDPPTAMIAP